MYYKIGQVVQEEKIYKFRECTFAILLLSPNVKRIAFSSGEQKKEKTPIIYSIYPSPCFRTFAQGHYIVW